MRSIANYDHDPCLGELSVQGNSLPTRTSRESKLFDILIIFLIFFFKKVYFQKYKHMTIKA